MGNLLEQASYQKVSGRELMPGGEAAHLPATSPRQKCLR
jgi:hypothetical protein